MSTSDSLQYRVAMFCSRNKDNKYVVDFVQRYEHFLTTDSDEELITKFESFVEAGKPNEFSRLYVTIDSRDPEKVQRNLIHWLIDNPESDLTRITNQIVSIAAKPECRITRKWMFDYDEDISLKDEFIKDIKCCDSEVEVEYHPTPNGLCIITSRGFDIRNLDLEDKWKNVELKKNSNRCIYWKFNS